RRGAGQSSHGPIGALEARGGAMTEETNEKWVTVASRASLSAGNMTGAIIGDVEIAVYNIDGEFYATDNLCTHAFALLSEGWLDGDVVECNLHGGRFEVKTGKSLG